MNLGFIEFEYELWEERKELKFTNSNKYISDELLQKSVKSQDLKIDLKNPKQHFLKKTTKKQQQQQQKQKIKTKQKNNTCLSQFQAFMLL